MSHYEGEGAPGDAAGAQSAGLSAQVFVNMVGAVLSVALLAGVAFWGYRLAMRDVSGVPVVRALEGPMRVAPDDPGGMQAAYQGLAVNAVAAEGGAAPAPERIVLAPPPVSLDAPEPALVTTDVTDAVLRRPEPESTPIEVIPASVPGIARSPLPRPRPDEDLVAETAARAVLNELSPGAGIEVDPETLTPGTRLVQLGAYEDVDAARAEWEAMASRFAAHMEGKGRVIQAIESGGKTFYRLRVHGFGDEAEARRFCAVLVAENATCIPVLIQ